MSLKLGANVSAISGLYNVVNLHKLTYTFPLNVLLYCVTFDVSVQKCERSQMSLGGEAFKKYRDYENGFCI